MEDRQPFVLMSALHSSINGSSPFSRCYRQQSHSLSTFPFQKWSAPSIPLHTCKTYIVVLPWGNSHKQCFGSIFPKIICFRDRRSYQRYTCSWLKDSTSWPETVNHQQYPDGLWLGLVMMHILGEFPGFVHDSFSFDFTGLKEVSQNITRVYVTEHFARRSAPTNVEILRSLLRGDVVVWYTRLDLYQFSSSVVYKHCFTGTFHKICFIFIQGNLPRRWGRA